MSPQWSPEVELTDAAATRMIESQFPDQKPITLQPLGVGWDNTAYRVNSKFVFRFPRRQMGAECLEAEVRVLPALARRLPPVHAEPDHGRTAHREVPLAVRGLRAAPGAHGVLCRSNRRSADGLGGAVGTVPGSPAFPPGRRLPRRSAGQAGTPESGETPAADPRGPGPAGGNGPHRKPRAVAGHHRGGGGASTTRWLVPDPRRSVRASSAC